MHTSTRLQPSRLLFLLASLVLSHTVLAGKNLSVGDQAPDWILPNHQNENISYYQDSAGQKTVLLFWATWCPYCAALMPELEKLRTELNDPNVKFYALNIWEDADPQAYMQKAGYGFNLILNADKVAKRYGVSGTPGLFVIGENKEILYIRTKGTEPAGVSAAIQTALTAPSEHSSETRQENNNETLQENNNKTLSEDSKEKPENEAATTEAE